MVTKSILAIRQSLFALIGNVNPPFTAIPAMFAQHGAKGCFRPQTVVMSQNEIHTSVGIRTSGQV